MAKRISSTQERLKEMMEALNITAADIVRKTGINKSTLSNYINGKRVADQEHLAQIADPYGIDPGWLMGYDAPMKAPVSPDDYDEAFVNRAVELYKQIDDLPPEKQAALEEFLSFLQFGNDSRH